MTIYTAPLRCSESPRPRRPQMNTTSSLICRPISTQKVPNTRLLLQCSVASVLGCFWISGPNSNTISHTTPAATLHRREQDEIRAYQKAIDFFKASRSEIKWRFPSCRGWIYWLIDRWGEKPTIYAPSEPPSSRWEVHIRSQDLCNLALITIYAQSNEHSCINPRGTRSVAPCQRVKTFFIVVSNDLLTYWGASRQRTQLLVDVHVDEVQRPSSEPQRPNGKPPCLILKHNKEAKVESA